MAKKKKASKKKATKKVATQETPTPKAKGKPRGKAARRTSEQVNEIINNIKDAIAMGNGEVSVAKACKMYNMPPQQYYRLKDRVSDTASTTNSAAEETTSNSGPSRIFIRDTYSEMEKALRELDTINETLGTATSFDAGDVCRFLRKFRDDLLEK
jgi:hypothetical protein